MSQTSLAVTLYKLLLFSCTSVANCYIVLRYVSVVDTLKKQYITLRFYFMGLTYSFIKLPYLRGGGFYLF